jgi:predicted kinase
MSGMSGSGKSTLSEAIKSLSPADTVICSADSFMVDDKGRYEFVPDKLKYCHEQCLAKANRYMQYGTKIVIIDNTNTTEWEYEPYIKAGKEYGYMVQRIIVDHKLHNEPDVHNVPERVRVDQLYRLRASL